MKVAVLSCHTPTLFRFRLDMMRAFLAAGCTVVAIGDEPEAAWTARFAAEGIAYRQVTVQRTGLNPLHDLKTLRSIRRVLAQERPDKVFTYQAKTVVYGSLAARRIRPRPEVYLLIAGLGSVFLGRSFKSKLVRLVLQAEYAIACRGVNAVFFQNSEDEAYFCAHRLLGKTPAVRIRGSGVNTVVFTPQPLPDTPAFLFTGRLIRDKGVGEYLQACDAVKREFPQARFLLVGPFDSNPSALQPADLQPYIDRGVVEYYGEQEDVRPYLAQCSVFVLPSYREGTPKTVLEAMACARPVIATDAVGCREAVVPGETGMLVAPYSADAVAEAMRWCLTHPEALPALGQAGRRRVEEWYDVRKVNRVILETMGIVPPADV